MYSEIKEFINDNENYELEYIIRFIINNIKSTKIIYFIYLLVNIALFILLYTINITESFLIVTLVVLINLMSLINNVIKIYKLNFLEYEIERYIKYYNKILAKNDGDVKDRLVKLFIDILQTLTLFSDKSRHNLFTIISKHDKEEFKHILV